MPTAAFLLQRPPSPATCLYLLQSCTSMADFLQIQAQMLRSGLADDPFAANKSLEFCAASPHGSLHHARNLFDQMPRPNTFAFNTLIRAFANSPFPAPALHLFPRMIAADNLPNSYTYSFLLKACARLSALEVGYQLHGFMAKSGVDSDIFSVNGLVNVYVNCGRIEIGRRLFNMTLHKDVVSWTLMLSGYVGCGWVDQAKRLFDEMPERGIVSWNAMMNGYVKSGDIDAARELFDRMPKRNVESWNTLIAGYARCGLLDMSRRLFDQMPERNAISWSAMITSYAQGECPAKALELFEEMKRVRVKPNWSALVSILSACTQLGALDQGMQVHAYIERNKMKVDSIIGTALIDMYSKCGYIDRALWIFYSLTSKDVFSWTAMIGGLAVNGHGARALELFENMREEGIEPNDVTFVGVLCACSHSGQVQLAWQYFDLMRTAYRIEPKIEHYGCMVDALGRAGLIQEAVSFVQSSSRKGDPVLWITLLGACWIHRNSDIAEYVLECLTELKPNDGGVYVLLSNIYAAKGHWQDARRVRMLMKLKGLGKIPGCSSIEVNGLLHEFCSGDQSHLKTVEIYQMLDEINCRLKQFGYEPSISPVLFDIAEEDKENVVAHHSDWSKRIDQESIP